MHRVTQVRQRNTNRQRKLPAPLHSSSTIPGPSNAGGANCLITSIAWRRYTEKDRSRSVIFRAARQATKIAPPAIPVFWREWARCCLMMEAGAPCQPSPPCRPPMGQALHRMAMHRTLDVPVIIFSLCPPHVSHARLDCP